MTRISSLAANNALVNQLLRTQTRLFNLQTQVSSEKVSQDYSGIAVQSQRLLNLENTTSNLKQFIQNNEQMDTRLNVSGTVVDAIRTTIDDFRKNLDVYSQGATKDETRVKTIQDDAFRALKSIEDYLNTDIDGRYLFSGARVDTQPVSFGLSTVANFQSTYDGARVSIPTTRDAQLEDFSFNKRSDTNAANWLQFERDQGATGVSRVTASSSEFSNVTVGSTITISGTGGVNDGTFEVTAVAGTTIDIKTEQLTDEAATPVTLSYQDPNNVNNTITLNSSVSFTRATDTIAFSSGDALTGVPVGTKITIAGAAVGPPTNNGSFTVKTAGANLVVESKRFTDQGTGGAPYFTFTTAANNLSFVDGGASADTITAPANTFQDASGAALVAGLKLTIAGTGTANDGNAYTIASVSADKSTVTLVTTDAVTAAANQNGTVSTTKAAGTVASNSYYSGDAITLTHRVSSDRDFEFDINAIDPAFEKAIRGIKLILQGTFGTEGGLDQNAQRIDQAKFMVLSSLNRAVGGTPPFGTELVGNVDQMQIDLAFDQVLVQNTNRLHTDFIGFLDASVADVENVDPLETITRLLDDQRALEASFQALARIGQLSLVNFL
ncbi:MAG: hypothetical protein HQ512_05400 [Rhodospirillales bacterium]|nr:hypothetical protein [Rhodospirillales bacterium]